MPGRTSGPIVATNPVNVVRRAVDDRGVHRKQRQPPREQNPASRRDVLPIGYGNAKPRTLERGHPGLCSFLLPDFYRIGFRSTVLVS